MSPCRPGPHRGPPKLDLSPPLGRFSIGGFPSKVLSGSSFALGTFRGQSRSLLRPAWILDLGFSTLLTNHNPQMYAVLGAGLAYLFGASRSGLGVGLRGWWRNKSVGDRP